MDSPDFACDGGVPRRRLRRHLEVRVRLVEERLPASRKVLEHEAGTRTLQRVATGAGAIFDVEAESERNTNSLKGKKFFLLHPIPTHQSYIHIRLTDGTTRIFL